MLVQVAVLTGVKIKKDRADKDFRMWPLAVLTGWPH